MKYCIIEITSAGEVFSTMVTQAQFEVHSEQFSSAAKEREQGRRHVLGYHGTNVTVALVELRTV